MIYNVFGGTLHLAQSITYARLSKQVTDRELRPSSMLSLSFNSIAHVSREAKREQILVLVIT